MMPSVGASHYGTRTGTMFLAQDVAPMTSTEARALVREAKRNTARHRAVRRVNRVRVRSIAELR